MDDLEQLKQQAPKSGTALAMMERAAQEAQERTRDLETQLVESCGGGL